MSAKPKTAQVALALAAMTAVLAACAAPATPQVVEKQVTVEVPKEVVKEVQVTTEVVKEVAKEQTPVRLSGFISTPAEENLLKARLFECSKANPDLDIKYEPIPGDYWQKLQALIASGETPDVFYMDIFQYPFYASKGVMLPIDDLMAKEGVKKEDFIPTLINAFSSEGKTYGIPKDFNTLALFYNKDLFTKAGVEEPTPSWTWDDLKAAATKLTDAGNKVFGFGVPPDPGRFPVFQMQAGGTNLMTPDFKDTTLDSAEAKQAAEFYTGFRKDGSGAFPNADLGVGWQGEAFGKGSIAMVMEGGWLIPYLRDQFPGLQYGATELPAGPKGKGNLLFTVAYVLSKDTKNPEASMKVVNCLTNIETQTAVLENGLALPSRTALQDLEVLKKDPIRSAIYAGTAYAQPFLYGLFGGKVLDNTGKALEAVYTANKTVDEALDEGAKNIRAELQE